MTEMSVRTARRLLFLGLVVIAPLPMLGYDAWIPDARFFLLAGVTTLVILFEGGAGPVPMIAVLFGAHALVYAGLLWAGAYVASRILGRVSPTARAIATWSLIAIGLAIGLGFEIYATPFGSAPIANLLGALS